MIKFYCQHCGAKISADLSDAGSAANCPSCGQDLVVPTEPSPTSIEQPVAQSTAGSLPPVPGRRHEVPQTSGKKMLKVWIPLIVAIVVGLAVFPKLLKGTRSDAGSSGQKKVSKTEISEAVESGAAFWKFQIGATYDDCIKIMKALKADGIVTDLSIGERFGGKPGNISVSGKSKSDLDGILTIPCWMIDLSFVEKRLDTIELMYGFRKEYPSNLFETQVKDMERLIGSEAVIEMKENDVGDRRQVATVEKNGLRAKITNKLDGDFSHSAPNILIYTPQ